MPPTERSPRERTIETMHMPGGGTVGVGAWVGAGGESIAAALAGETAAEVESAWRWNMVAIGGERRSAAAAWAERTGAREFTDLRELAQANVAVVLVMGRECPSADDLRRLLEGDRRVLVVGAQPPTLELIAHLGDRASRIEFVPSFVAGTAMAIADPMLREFRTDGPTVSIAVRMGCRPGEISVDSLLLDACLAASSVASAVESITAVRRAPTDSSEPAVLAAIAQCETGALLALDVADGGGWRREVRFLGPQGSCTVSDDMLERRDAQGTVRERHDVAASTNAVHASIESMRRIAAARMPGYSPRLLRDAIALADAVRLSARTGNAESPKRVLELAERP